MRAFLRAMKRRVKDRLTRAAFARLSVHLGDMNQPLALIEYLGQTCRGVIHVGANYGQEFDSYRNAGLASVVYIEPIPAIFEALKQRVSVDPRHHPICALCSDADGAEVDFFVASNEGQSSSMLALGSTAEEHPHVRYVEKLQLKTVTLDRIIFGTPGLAPEALDCLVMDVQGAEMKVLQGAARTLAQCRFVFTEITEGGTYQGDTPYREIVAFLEAKGFKLKALGLNRHHWGTAFLARD